MTNCGPCQDVGERGREGLRFILLKLATEYSDWGVVRWKLASFPGSSQAFGHIMYEIHYVTEKLNFEEPVN